MQVTRRKHLTLVCLIKLNIKLTFTAQKIKKNFLFKRIYLIMNIRYIKTLYIVILCYTHCINQSVFI